MRTRPLIPEELQRLQRAYGRPKVPRPIWDFFSLSALISIPLFLVFFIGSVVAEKRTPRDAFKRGGVILLAGPAFLLMQYIRRGGRPVPNAFGEIHEDMRAGIGQIREYRVRRVWPLIDEGNETEPDYLAELDGSKCIALLAMDVVKQLPFRDRLEVCVLPNSKVVVSVRLLGEKLFIEGVPIRTDCLWRNDDLPWEKPISLKRLPLEIQHVIAAREA